MNAIGLVQSVLYCKAKENIAWYNQTVFCTHKSYQNQISKDVKKKRMDKSTQGKD